MRRSAFISLIFVESIFLRIYSLKKSFHLRSRSMIRCRYQSLWYHPMDSVGL